MKSIILAVVLLSSLVGIAQKRTTAPKKAIDTTNFFGKPVTMKTQTVTKGQTVTLPAHSYVQSVKSTVKDNRVEVTYENSTSTLAVYVDIGKTQNFIPSEFITMGRNARFKNWYEVNRGTQTVSLSGAGVITYFTLYQAQ